MEKINKDYLRRIKRQKQVVSRILFVVIASLTISLGMFACAIIAWIYYDNDKAVTAWIATGVSILILFGMLLYVYCQEGNELENLVYRYED